MIGIGKVAQAVDAFSTMTLNSEENKTNRQNAEANALQYMARLRRGTASMCPEERW